MDCREVLSFSFFSSIAPTTSTVKLRCCRGAHLASCAKNIGPISASSAVNLRPISRPKSRRTPLDEEAREIGRKFSQNADNDMRAMCEEGQVKAAVEYIELLHKGGLRLSSKSYGFLLHECAKLKALDEGKRVHALLISSDVRMDVSMRNHLLSLYTKCGCLKEARLMFEAMGTARDVVSWTTMISACAQYGQFHEAIKMYHSMRKRRVKPNKITYVCLLKACSQPERLATPAECLATGKLLHEHIIQRSLDGDKYVGGALVEMYFKFGDVKTAREAFYVISEKTAFLWNLLVTRLVQNGKSKDALKVYYHMRYRHRVEPCEETWVHILKACGELELLEEGRFAHFCLCRDGIELDGSLGHELVHMYIACGSLVDARQIFDQLQSKPVSLWKDLIEAYTKCDEHEEAAKLTYQVQEHEKLVAESSEIDSTEESQGDIHL